MHNCVFCDISKNLKTQGCVLTESEKCFAIPDLHPISQGHTLVITKEHFENLMETNDDDLKDAINLVKKTAKLLLQKYPDIKGFNYISNQNKAAKQVIFHLHIHIIPRYEQ